MRASAACLLLLAPLLSGCVVDQLRGLEPPEPVPTVLPWGLSDCTFVVAVVPVPASRLEGRLPPGFTPLTPAEIGLPADPRGNANVGVEAWKCNGGVGHNASAELGLTDYGAVFSFVRPPDDLAVEGSLYHFVKWDVLIPDETRRGILLDHGVPAQNGTVTVHQFRALGEQTLFDVGMELNGTFSLGGSTAVPDARLRSFAFTEYTQTPHGLATWQTNATAATVTSGSGPLTLPPGIMQDVVGAGRTQAYYMAGTGGALSNGTITLPPKPLA